MILKTALLIKILLVLASGAGFFWLLRKHCSKKQAILFACCVALIGAFLGQTVSSFVPPLTDTVTITALGEKNPEASAYEVTLVDFTVDEETCAIGEIASGKWFWFGSHYMWRPETDTRQPEGTTRTIQLEVPVGWSRTLNFSAGIYRGIALVEYGESEEIVDLYAPSPKTVSVSVGRSSSMALIFNQIRYLAVYCITLLALFGAVTCITVLFLKNPERMRAWFASNGVFLIIGAIALLQLLFALRYAGIDGFWEDEMYEIGWSVTSGSLFDRMFQGSAPLPLFSIFNGFWYSIVPYGERWLLLPMELGTALGIFFVGLAGKELRDNFVGILSALFASVSAAILTQGSYEIRSYGFYFASAALLLFLFLRHIRRRQYESWKATIGMSLCMIFFAGMHYHAVFSCIVLFLIDALFLFYVDKFNVKLGVRLVVPYAAAAMSYVPNLLSILTSDKLWYINSNTWQPQPTYQRVAQLFDYFSDGSDTLLFLFAVGYSVIVVLVYHEIRLKKAPQDIHKLQLAVPVLWMTIIILFIVIYGNYRYHNGVSSLWSTRYFFCLMPAFFIISAIGVHSIGTLAKNALGNDMRAFWVVPILFCFLIVPSSINFMHQNAHIERETFRAAADWLYAQGNTVYNDKTVIVSCPWRILTQGWTEYYLEEQGRRDPLNVIYMADIHEATMDEYDTVYLYYETQSANPLLRKILEEDFVLTADNKDVLICTYVRK